MSGRTWIVHLLGFPAVGKRTVAVALVAAAAAQGDRFVLLDNHLTGNPILAVLDQGGGGFVGDEVWAFVDEVRDVQDRAILALAPTDLSFVFTNANVSGSPNGPRAVARLVRLAEARGSTYVPVVLRCDLDVLLGRVAAPDRRAHGKWVVPAEVRRHVAGRDVHLPDEPHLLDLDTTSTAPAETARALLAHLAAIEEARL